MTSLRIDPTPDSASLAAARGRIRARYQRGVSLDSVRRSLEWLDRRAEIARRVPGGWVLEEIWDKAGGYPEHAWGFVQHSVRPYVQGYGCDGSTDECVHRIAARLCHELGIDYAAAYLEAYADDSNPDSTRQWASALLTEPASIADTILMPELSDDTLRLMLSDLYQINNRSLGAVLQDRLAEAGRDVRDWHIHEERLRAASLSRAVPHAGHVGAAASA